MENHKELFYNIFHFIKYLWDSLMRFFIIFIEYIYKLKHFIILNKNHSYL